ncbi:MAG TPA: phosphatase PAP2 family protein [Chitinophagaceae bacterium]|nr:phosphatase PAP2 family protein [Chitinophagaceae bacterium]
METQLAVDEKNNLVEMRPRSERVPSGVRLIARIISYIFHPVFIPVYLCWFVVRTQSYLFATFSQWEKTVFILRFGIMYVMFPLVSVLLMKALGFVNSFQLKTQRDRIIPYVVCMIYYWWMWYVLHNQPEFPKVFVILSLAIFIASVAGLMANISMKVSMHAMAAGIMVAFVMLIGFSQDISFGVYISLAILLTGMICTSRFIDGDHNPREVYGGLLIGVLSILLAIKFA